MVEGVPRPPVPAAPVAPPVVEERRAPDVQRGGKVQTRSWARYAIIGMLACMGIALMVVFGMKIYHMKDDAFNKSPVNVPRGPGGHERP